MYSTNSLKVIIRCSKNALIRSSVHAEFYILNYILVYRAPIENLTKYWCIIEDNFTVSYTLCCFLCNLTQRTRVRVWNKLSTKQPDQVRVWDSRPEFGYQTARAWVRNDQSLGTKWPGSYCSKSEMTYGSTKPPEPFAIQVMQSLCWWQTFIGIYQHSLRSSLAWGLHAWNAAWPIPMVSYKWTQYEFY